MRLLHVHDDLRQFHDALLVHYRGSPDFHPFPSFRDHLRIWPIGIRTWDANCQVSPLLFQARGKNSLKKHVIAMRFNLSEIPNF